MANGSSELTKLGELISNDEFRESIGTNFREAAESHGVDLAQIPGEVLDTLEDLSKAELAVLARVKARLIEANVDPIIRAELV